ncbi:hypothetical protein GCM10022223_50750 [Kineosporia mesophila]|uniref:Uncharacterized protein n=1 Tax=Kineosporia mesophila TaxID=566012 RepID=A0ABP7A919_9ACTN
MAGVCVEPLPLVPEALDELPEQADTARTEAIIRLPTATRGVLLFTGPAFRNHADVRRVHICCTSGRSTLVDISESFAHGAVLHAGRGERPAGRLVVGAGQVL